MKNNSFLTFLAFLLCVGYLPAQTLIQDADANTRVETERVANQDIIWFRRAGVDRMRLIGNRLEFLNNGSSIFIGDNAGAADDLTSNQNVFIGENAGTANVTGAFNIALGRAALRTSTGGSNNIAIGTNSLQNTTSSTNLGLGASTLVENTSGERNVAIGFNAIRASITASGNTGIGSESLRRALDSDNMGIGWRAGYNLTNGSGNVFIGNEAGRGGAANTPYNASGNIFIGNQAGYNETGSNLLYIANSSTSSPLIYGNFSSNRVGINGYLGVGTQTPTYPLDVVGQMRSSTVIPFLSFDRIAGPANAGIDWLDNGIEKAWLFEHSDNTIRWASGRSGSYWGYWDGINLDSTNRVSMGAAPVSGSKLYVSDSLVTFAGGVGNFVNSNTDAIDVPAVRGTSNPAAGYGFGGYFSGGYRGVVGIGEGTTYTGGVIGVLGSTNGTGVGTRYGIFGEAYGGSENWGGYFPTKVYAAELRVGNTTAATGYRLMVDGKAICEELKVQNSVSWPDYVFEKTYELKPLSEVEAFIAQNGHLPNIPSATEVEAAKGFHVGEMQTKTLEKVEELTLYLIDANKRIEQLEAENAKLNARMEAVLTALEAKK